MYFHFQLLSFENCFIDYFQICYSFVLPSFSYLSWNRQASLNVLFRIKQNIDMCCILYFLYTVNLLCTVLIYVNCICILYTVYVYCTSFLLKIFWKSFLRWKSFIVFSFLSHKTNLNLEVSRKNFLEVL